ncbi:MFS transporter [Cryptosporangium minutisporangium]|uniref:MFS transporter n=1 Tax=Cryptosporangium minutisporangium TaxID=113569 RepID=A0ABP6T8Y6_9ACTN
MVNEMLRPSARSDARPEAAATPRFIVPVLASGGLVAAVMQTIVVPLIPSLPNLLDAAPTDATWVITATLLAGSVATPVAGRLGDMFGKRRMMLISLGLLVVGAVFSALSSSLALMVVGRVLQGAGSGAIPLGISLMKDILPAEKQGSAIAFMSSTMGTGAAIGLPASALVAEHLDWHVLFWGAAAIGLLALIAVAVTVPESGLRPGGRFDVFGMLGLAVWLTALLLVISKGNAWGWTSAPILGLAGVVAVVVPVWVLYELRRSGPLVDLRTTMRRPVLVTNLASVMIGFSMYASVMILPQLLQAPTSTGFGLGQSMLAAGLCMAPSGLVMLVASPLSARLSAARGARTTLMVGAGVLAAAFGTASFLMHATWQVVLVGTVTGLGVALAYAAMPTLIMQNVPLGETAAANGLNTLMRSLGTSLSSAVMAVLLADAFLTDGGGALPSGLGAFRLAYVVAAVAAATGALLCLLLPRRTD